MGKPQKKKKSLKRNVFFEHHTFGRGIDPENDDYDDDDDFPYRYPKTRKFNNELFMYGVTSRKKDGLEWDKLKFTDNNIKYRTVAGKHDGETVYRLFGRVKDLAHFKEKHNPNAQHELQKIHNEYKIRGRKQHKK